MKNTASPTRRGAPLGNTNAIKHGFYSKQFDRKDIRDLENARIFDLTDEINLLRVKIRRLGELSQNDNSIPLAIDSIRAISFATICLTRVINMQNIVKPTCDAQEEILNALSDWRIQLEEEALQKEQAALKPQPQRIV